MFHSGCNHCQAETFEVIRPYLGFENVDIVKCLNCDLLQANPPPSDEFLNDYYQHSFGNSLERGYGMTDKDEKGYRLRAYHQFNFIRQFCAIRNENSNEPAPAALDIGCHAGSLLSLFKERGWQVTGIDPNPRSAYGEKWYGIKIIQKPFYPALFPKESFDGICHSHVLEHVRNPKEYLTEFYRLLKPGGWVFIEVPNELRFGKKRPDQLIPHLYFFTPQTLNRLAESVGFEVVCTRVLDIGGGKGMEWLKLRFKACYDARGHFNPFTFLPYFGRLFRQDRFFKGVECDAQNLRVILRKPMGSHAQLV